MKEENRYPNRLYLDTLKVSTIEQTAENAEARGGKGNAKLIVWDFGKEITVNIEDALFSPISISLLIISKLVSNLSSLSKYNIFSSILDDIIILPAHILVL